MNQHSWVKHLELHLAKIGHSASSAIPHDVPIVSRSRFLMKSLKPLVGFPALPVVTVVVDLGRLSV